MAKNCLYFFTNLIKIDAYQIITTILSQLLFENHAIDMNITKYQQEKIKKVINESAIVKKKPTNKR